jgi:hypothetical protein
MAINLFLRQSKKGSVTNNFLKVIFAYSQNQFVHGRGSVLDSEFKGSSVEIAIDENPEWLFLLQHFKENIEHGITNLEYRSKSQKSENTFFSYFFLRYSL